MPAAGLGQEGREVDGQLRDWETRRRSWGRIGFLFRIYRRKGDAGVCRDRVRRYFKTLDLGLGDKTKKKEAVRQFVATVNKRLRL